MGPGVRTTGRIALALIAASSSHETEPPPARETAPTPAVHEISATVPQRVACDPGEVGVLHLPTAKFAIVRGMNNLAYGTQDPNKIAEKVTELIQEETKAAPALEVQMAGAPATTLKSVVNDGLSLLWGGKAPTCLFTLNYTLTAPRPMTVSVPIDRQGVGAHGGRLTFSTPIGKPIAHEVVLGEPKFFGGAKFAGDEAAAAKLNGNAALMKKLKGFVRTKLNTGGVDVEIPQLFKLVPGPDGTMLIANNMAKSMKMGFAMSLEINELAEIAKLIEATL